MRESEENAKRELLNPPIAETVAEAIEEIPNVVAVEEAKEPRDAATSQLRLQAEKLQLQISRLSDENDELKDVHELRKEYIPKLFWRTVGWLAFVVVTIWRVAADREFYFSENVLIALITSTTVNVIGIFVIAARWLFPHKK